MSPRNVISETEIRTSNPYKEQYAYDELRPKHEPRFMARIRDIERSLGFLTPLRWRNVIYFALSHGIVLAWLGYDLITGTFAPKWQTLLYLLICYILGSFGVTGGVHRYWTHRSFKAKEPLRWFLLYCYVLSGETTIFEWARDHRVHHKFTETIADPYDTTRGFFFSHMGWLMMKRHPAVRREGRNLDLSDLTSDPLVQLHNKYFILMKFIICFIIPSITPPLLWGESWEQSILVTFIIQLIIAPHVVFSINSVAHMWGNKPYDPNIKPVENWALSLITLGEGWHNFHHTFPWDYKTSELPYFLNLSTLMIDGFAWLGWAYDMKRASPELVQSVVKNRNKLPTENKNFSD